MRKFIIIFLAFILILSGCTARSKPTEPINTNDPSQTQGEPLLVERYPYSVIEISETRLFGENGEFGGMVTGERLIDPKGEYHIYRDDFVIRILLDNKIDIEVFERGIIKGKDQFSINVVENWGQYPMVITLRPNITPKIGDKFRLTISNIKDTEDRLMDDIELVLTKVDEPKVRLFLTDYKNKEIDFQMGESIWGLSFPENLWLRIHVEFSKDMDKTSVEEVLSKRISDKAEYSFNWLTPRKLDIALKSQESPEPILIDIEGAKDRNGIPILAQPRIPIIFSKQGEVVKANIFDYYETLLGNSITKDVLVFPDETGFLWIESPGDSQVIWITESNGIFRVLYPYWMPYGFRASLFPEGRMLFAGTRIYHFDEVDSEVVYERPDEVYVVGSSLSNDGTMAALFIYKFSGYEKSNVGRVVLVDLITKEANDIPIEFRLTQETMIYGGQYGEWHPDGERILIDEGNSSLVINLTSKEIEKRYFGRTKGLWSPSGRYLTGVPSDKQETRVIFEDNGAILKHDIPWDAKWSPYTDILAYTKNNKVYVYDVVYDVEKEIAKGELIHWSPDGEHLYIFRK